MKRLFAIFITVCLVAVAAAIGLVVVHQHIASPTPTPTVKPKSTPTPTPTLDPLSITAIREHAVPASTITTTQTLASRGGCTTSVVSFVSDSLTEYALLQVPATAKPVAGYPVIILAHGYITPASYQTAGTDYQGFMNSFCGAGYAILKLDYRGNGQSGGTPTTGDIDPGYTYDVLDLTASLPSLPNVNARDVVWLGHSMGGAVMLRAAVASHNLPVKAIVFASGVVGSAQDIFYNWPSAMIPADLIPAKTAFVAAHGTPQSNPTFWHDISAINYLSAIPAPVEINHGTADTVVPIAFSGALDTGLTSAGKTHVYYTYPGGDHQYSLNGSGAAFISHTLSFLAQYTK